MGKEIVREESPKDPGRRSRLWFPEDIVQVLKTNKGTSNIEIIHLDSPLIEDEEAIEWDGKAFEKMPNLRILIIRKCRFSNAPKYLPNSLKVLEWLRYPSEELPSDFESKQLVICKISHGVPVVSQTSKSAPNVLQNFRKTAQVMLQVSHRVFQDEMTWRLIGLMSSCFAVQLLTINWILILVAIMFGCPLFVMHSSLNSQPEVASGDQVIHSSSDSEPNVDSRGQHVIVMKQV
ncbi:hypothetical protein P8452_51422 [Trifolium repens]|nr:hypothetical protein P8452_51422 [Trifolium repens]